MDYGYENQIVGKLLGYYRELKYLETNDSFYQQNNFISFKSEAILSQCVECPKKCKNKKSICSIDTLRRIEKGEVVKNICYYIDLSNKLGRIYKLTQPDIKKLNALREAVFAAITSMDKELLRSTLKSVEYFLNQRKNYIYFEEILLLYQAVLNYRLYGIYPKQNLISFIEYLLPCLDNMTQQCVNILLHDYYAFVEMNSEKSLDYLSMILKSDFSILEFVLSNKAMMYSPRDFYKYMKGISVENLSYFNQYTVLQRQAHAALNVEFYEEAYDYICKSIEVIENNKQFFSELEYIKSCMRKGIIAYQLDRFSEAFENFDKVFQYDIDKLLYNLFLFMECFEKLGKLEERKKYLTIDNYRKIRNNHIKVIFKYYQMKNQKLSKLKYKELAEYICNDLKPFIRDNTYYHLILLDDLTECCDKTSSYRYLRDFVNYDKEHNV